MAVVVAAIGLIDRLTEIIGRVISWLTLIMVFLVVTVVVMRYFLEMGSIALQELVTYIHAMVFMLGIAFTLKRGGHVRVDIFYRDFPAQRKALVDLLGGLFFLLPVTLLIFVTSWDYVAASWAITETSAENNGLPFIYLLKTLMLIMPGMLLLQGIAEVLKSGLILSGRGPTEHETVGPIL
ncbi:MAG: TRAP transporter small permease subunit [Porticoccaceae bacterium]|jgi:TRAP-type mannitol/chloroaromatic compound transport system permease small subunit|nr:TRAP transporter small permease subunit [Porticoccaceae bacterium]